MTESETSQTVGHQNNAMSKTEEKIKRLWDRGIRDPRIIAKKLGHSGNALTAGIERVVESLKALNLK